MKKLVDKDPFSNVSELGWFECQCCCKCVKFSYWKEKLGRFVNADEMNQPKCSIQRDIVTRMASNNPIKQETIDICQEFILHGVLCPYLKTERKKYTKKVKNQTTLEWK